MTKSLLSPISIGTLHLPNRVIMAPMTRGRCGKAGVPDQNIVDYYTQRASAGLIISEGAYTSAQAKGWWGEPGIHLPEHVQGWKLVTSAVHEKGGRMFCQLWHCGRCSHSSFRPEAKDGRGVAPSPIKVEGHKFAYSPIGPVEAEVPRELATVEVEAIPNEFRLAAQCAKDAGFDGIELHAGGGFIFDSFLQSKTNKRSDKYGGSLKNRFRLLKDTVDAVCAVFSLDQIAVRLSPNSMYNDMGSVDFRESFVYFIKELSAMDLAYLHVIEGPGFGFHNVDEHLTLKEIRVLYSGLLMGNYGYTKEKAEMAISSGDADMISFGRDFISNPDLVERFARGAALNTPADHNIFYSPAGGNLGSKGYTDFPSLS